MLVHIVLFRLRPEVAETEILSCMEGLRQLVGVVSEIRGYHVQRDEIGGERSATFGVLSRFDDADALRRYQQHPAHQAAAARPIALSEWVKTWDYQEP